MGIIFVLTGKPQLLKQVNETMIIDLVRKHGPISRADIAKMLQISRPTISKIIGGLLERKLIIEIGEGVSTGGKKPILLQINKNSYVIGIHITFPHMKLALVNNLGEMIGRRSWPPAQTLEETVEQMKQTAAELLRSARLSAENLSAVGVAVAGITDSTTGHIKHARFFPHLEGSGLKKALEAHFNIPVFLDNDVYMGVFGEAQVQKLQSGSIAFVRFGKQIGLGMMINGVVYRGGHYAAGEIGDMVINASGQLNGGFEPNGGYLERWLSKPDSVYPGFPDFGDETAPDPQLIHFALCLVNIICILDPQRLFIGGEILENSEAYFQRIKQLVKRILKRGPEVETAFFREDAELIGSVFAAINSLQQSITITRHA